MFNDSIRIACYHGTPPHCSLWQWITCCPVTHLLHLATQMDILHYRCFVPDKGSSRSNNHTHTDGLKCWVHTQASPLQSSLLLEYHMASKLASIIHHLGFTLLERALQHPKVVDDYLKVEIAEHHVISPFPKENIPAEHISRFGVIPKHHTPNKWRLIVDLSHPANNSINDGIPKDLCSLTYITVDTAVNHIIELGPGTLLAKIDIKSAFRLLPVHPTDRHLLAMEWNKGIYIDTCLPFGLRSAPKLYNILADLFCGYWISRRRPQLFIPERLSYNGASWWANLS